MISLVHSLGALMFLGGMIVSLAWVVLAKRNNEPVVLSFAFKSVTVLDLTFTTVGVLLLMPTGILLANNWGGIFGTSWITASLVLTNLAGLLWMGFLLRYQFKLARLASASLKAKNSISEEVYTLLNKWFILVIITIILPLIAFILMVMKPTLW